MKTIAAKRRRWAVMLTDRTRLGAPLFLVSRFGGITSVEARAMTWPTKREAGRWAKRVARPSRYVCTLVRIGERDGSTD